jgi:hypothetical protein
MEVSPDDHHFTAGPILPFLSVMHAVGLTITYASFSTLETIDIKELITCYSQIIVNSSSINSLIVVLQMDSQA